MGPKEPTVTLGCPYPPSTPGLVNVGWAAGDQAPESIQIEVLNYVAEFLGGYVRKNRRYGFDAAITEIGMDPTRRNDQQRAAWIAPLYAKRELALPPIAIYGLPDDPEAYA